MIVTVVTAVIIAAFLVGGTILIVEDNRQTPVTPVHRTQAP